MSLVEPFCPIDDVLICRWFKVVGSPEDADSSCFFVPIVALGVLELRDVPEFNWLLVRYQV